MDYNQEKDGSGKQYLIVLSRIAMLLRNVLFKRRHYFS